MKVSRTKWLFAVAGVAAAFAMLTACTASGTSRPTRTPSATVPVAPTPIGPDTPLSAAVVAVFSDDGYQQGAFAFAIGGGGGVELLPPHPGCKTIRPTISQSATLKAVTSGRRRSSPAPSASRSSPHRWRSAICRSCPGDLQPTEVQAVSTAGTVTIKLSWADNEPTHQPTMGVVNGMPFTANGTTVGMAGGESDVATEPDASALDLFVAFHEAVHRGRQLRPTLSSC